MTEHLSERLQWAVTLWERLEECLAALHRDDGLMARIHKRSAAAGGVTTRAQAATAEAATAEAASEPPGSAGVGGSIAEENAAWASSLLAWLHHEVAVQPKLFPPGLILHQSRTAPNPGDAAEVTGGLPSSSFVAGVEHSFYRSMILSGTSMFAAHMPQSYARVLVGNCHEPYARSVTLRELCLG